MKGNTKYRTSGPAWTDTLAVAKDFADEYMCHTKIILRPWDSGGGTDVEVQAYRFEGAAAMGLARHTETWRPETGRTLEAMVLVAFHRLWNMVDELSTPGARRTRQGLPRG